MKYSKYPAYKDSGVEWLGEIPIKWNRIKTAYLFSSAMGQTILKEDLIDDGKYPVYSATAEDKFFGKVNKATVILKRNDIVIPARGNSIGYVKIVKDTSTTTQTTIYCQPLTMTTNSKYIYYYMLGLKENLFYFVQTAIPQITVSEVLSNPLLMPSFQEQKTIANYLDKATAKIDTLIEKQTKLIELLREKRQAVISTAVTRGLDNTVAMKDSGVEWLGEIPEGWGVKKFKYLFQIRKRISGKLGFDILSITQQGIKVKDIESGKGQLSSDYTKYQHVYKGDFAMNHMDLLTGFVDLAKCNGVTSPDYRVFTLVENMASADYYLYILQMGYLNKIFYPLGQGSSEFGRWRLPAEAFKEFHAPFPPLDEQKNIAIYIEKSLTKFENLITKSTKAIDLLKEKRTALISAAVTGKIDVRNAS